MLTVEEVEREIIYRQEIENEERKILQIQEEQIAVLGLEKFLNFSIITEEKCDPDQRSVYITNVDYDVKQEELEQHLTHCGTIRRVTIPYNKVTGKPQGFAYVEFAKKHDITAALKLNGTTLRGRPLKIVPKKTRMLKNSLLCYKFVVNL